MRSFAKRFLGAQVFLAFVATCNPGMMIPSYAGIPVIDGGNLTQNIVSAQESVAQTLKQILQYQIQMQQYENMLQNTVSARSFIWDQAQATMDGLRGAIDTLSYYKNQLGSLNSYLSKFQDINYYKLSPCFTSAGCSAAEWAAIEKVQELALQSQKKANDALFKGIDQQQANLQGDAAQLRRLQSNAQGSDGQMQAIQYANQLASHQANQLLQIRALLIAQQNAVGTRMQADANLEAQQAAAHSISTEGRINRTASPKNWLDLNR